VSSPLHSCSTLPSHVDLFLYQTLDSTARQHVVSLWLLITTSMPAHFFLPSCLSKFTSSFSYPGRTLLPFLSNALFYFLSPPCVVGLTGGGGSRVSEKYMSLLVPLSASGRGRSARSWEVVFASGKHGLNFPKGLWKGNTCQSPARRTPTGLQLGRKILGRSLDR
jgi:hypothetical protein